MNPSGWDNTVSRVGRSQGADRCAAHAGQQACAHARAALGRARVARFGARDRRRAARRRALGIDEATADLPLELGALPRAEPCAPGVYHT